MLWQSCGCFGTTSPPIKMLGKWCQRGFPGFGCPSACFTSVTGASLPAVGRHFISYAAAPSAVFKPFSGPSHPPRRWRNEQKYSRSDDNESRDNSKAKAEHHLPLSSRPSCKAFSVITHTDMAQSHWPILWLFFWQFDNIAVRVNVVPGGAVGATDAICDCTVFHSSVITDMIVISDHPTLPIIFALTVQHHLATNLKGPAG